MFSEPWIIHMSRQNMKLYYFNTANRASQFELPADALCSYSWVVCRISIKLMCLLE